MATNRIISRDVAIADPIMAHTDESTTIMLQRLKNLFTGVCVDGMLILNVTGIVAMEPAEIELGVAIGTGHAMVQFSANVLEYVRGDVVAKFVVVKKDENVLQARLLINGEMRVFVTIEASTLTESIAIGQKIIVRFIRLDYMYGMRSINSIGEIYMPKRESRVYQCGVSEYAITTQAEQMLEKLAELQEKLRNSPDWERCRDALMGISRSGKSTARSAAAASANTHKNALDLVKLASTEGHLPAYLARDYRVPITPDRAIVLSYDVGDAFPSDYMLITGVSHETIVIELLRAEIEALTLVIDMAEAYAGDEFARHANLWKVMAESRV